MFAHVCAYVSMYVFIFMIIAAEPLLWGYFLFVFIFLFYNFPLLKSVIIQYVRRCFGRNIRECFECLFGLFNFFFQSSCLIHFILWFCCICKFIINFLKSIFIFCIKKDFSRHVLSGMYNCATLKQKTSQNKISKVSGRVGCPTTAQN